MFIRVLEEQPGFDSSKEDYIASLSQSLSKQLGRLSQPSVAEDLLKAIVEADIDRIDQLLDGLESLSPVLPFINPKFWIPDDATISKCETQADEVKYLTNWNELSFDQWRTLQKCAVRYPPFFPKP